MIKALSFVARFQTYFTPSLTLNQYSYPRNTTKANRLKGRGAKLLA